jgi:hypothetical protein
MLLSGKIEQTAPAPVDTTPRQHSLCAFKMTMFDDAVTLFGKTYDSPDVSEFLAQQPAHKFGKPSDGRQDLTCKPGGFDFVFEDKNAGGGRRQNRSLTAIFLFNEGVDKHVQCRWPLPFGFSFHDQRASLIAKRLPDRTWVIGEGRVPLNHPKPDSDTWACDAFNLIADYLDNGTKLSSFCIVPPKPLNIADEWKPPATWQSLSGDPARMLEAIKLYKAENAASTADAKAASRNSSGI